jgi:hypothetical protein
VLVDAVLALRELGISAPFLAQIPEVPSTPRRALVQEPGEELAQSLPVCGLDKLLEDLHIVNVEDFEAIRHAVNLDTTDRPAGDPEPEQGSSTKPILELLLSRSL